MTLKLPILRSTLKYIPQMRHSCFDRCKWKCDFDKDGEVFCHRIADDITKDQIEILKLVGCGSWALKEETNNGL